jgi:hypothetical protein
MQRMTQFSLSIYSSWAQILTWAQALVEASATLGVAV